MGGKGRKVVVAVAVIVIVAVLLLTPAVQGLLYSIFISPFQKTVPKYVDYRLERDLTVSAGGGELVNFTIEIAVPSNLTAGDEELQTVISSSFSPNATFHYQKYDDQWSTWEHGVLSGSEQFQVRVVYDIRVETKVWNIGRSDSLDLSAVPQSLKEHYLGNEWKIVVDEPPIQTTSAAIVKNESNVYQILADINRWMLSNVRYPAVPNESPQSSVETLSSKVGDCDDQAFLFCALARAAGVPAWVQLGALYSSSEDSWGGHGWVQTYVPLKSGGGDYVVIDTVNRDFLLWRPNRLAEFTADGNGEHLSDYYYCFVYTAERGTYSPGHKPSFEEAYTSLEVKESSEKVVIGSWLFTATSVQVEAIVADQRALKCSGFDS
jgi:hypothetical protein